MGSSKGRSGWGQLYKGTSGWGHIQRKEWVKEGVGGVLEMKGWVGSQLNPITLYRGVQLLYEVARKSQPNNIENDQYDHLVLLQSCL